MNRLPRITEILKIELFKITCRWTTGEIRVNDFADNFQTWKNQSNTLLLNLQQYEDFKYVSVSDSGTLCWATIPVYFENFEGKQQRSMLDLCPDTLYADSKPIKAYKLVLAEAIVE